MTRLLRLILCTFRGHGATVTRKPAIVHPGTGRVMFACACGHCGATWMEHGK